MAEWPDPARRFGIAPGNHTRLLRVLAGCAGLDRVWIFGSRARGHARHESDIDLAVDAPTLTASAVNRLRSQIDDLGLVYRIDLIWLQDRIDGLLRREIDGCKQLFWQRPAIQAAVMPIPASTVTNSPVVLAAQAPSHQAASAMSSCAITSLSDARAI